jgi:hypothetical protein
MGLCKDWADCACAHAAIDRKIATAFNIFMKLNSPGHGMATYLKTGKSLNG